VAPPVGGCSLRGLLRIQPRLSGQHLRPRLSESVANCRAASPRRVLCRGCETGTACHSWPSSLSPTGRFALFAVPSCSVSVSFVGTYSRQPLPLVNGSPVP